MRRQYPFHFIEPRWQQHWEREQTFKAFNPGDTIPAEHPFAKRHGADAMSQANVAGGKAPSKFYILDMFPYPSGAGLHVGHPEGYTATDILARYRRAQGRHVLHPMGWDSFGLPAEQYAVKTGQHPRKTTETNIANFTRQIKSLGFSYDWSREIATTDVGYFKWTQWIFLKLYNSWFNSETNKAEPIETLKYPEALVERVAGSLPASPECQQAAGNTLEARRREYRDSKRLAYVSEAPVNWCPELGTVLANEEVIDGKSEVGGFPVIRKPMRQWMLRITAYAEKLLANLDTIDWSDSLKEMQRNWIGRSEGAEVDFAIEESDRKLRVFTTRPDTLFGATFMVVAPESRLFDDLIPAAYPPQTPTDWRFSAAGAISPSLDVQAYRDFVAGLSDLERQLGKSACFTGLHAINPANGQRIPIFLSEYVLASYGTGAIMAVPAHDERDFEFAKKFKLPIVPVVGSFEPFPSLSFDRAVGYESPRRKEELQKVNGKDVWIFTSLDDCFVGDGISVNSANQEVSLNSLPVAEAKKKITAWLEEKGLGKKTINYKLRDWLFSRQRYWGEPFPIIWKKDVKGNLQHEALPESVLVWERGSDNNLVPKANEQVLPVHPPDLNDYKPTPSGEPPLVRAKDWVTLPDGSLRETNTMPQWAGSCWYYLRYLDAKNNTAFVGKEAEAYWMGTTSSLQTKAAGLGSDSTPETQDSRLQTKPGVDLYVGGTEHAVLHLLYARFWHKVLFDLGHVTTAEPFYKLVNQGLILGELEHFGFKRSVDPKDHWISAELVTDVVSSGGALTANLKSDGSKVFGIKVPADRIDTRGGKLVLKTLPDVVIESRSFKMSKSRGNVVNPDDILKEFGADAFRLYEMFMGPLQDTKPWSTKGVEGVYRFLGRVWRLFVDEESEKAFELAETTAEAPGRGELLDLIKLDARIKDTPPTPAQLKTLHTCIKKVTEDLEGMRFNTAISAMMVFVNDAMTWEQRPWSVLRDFLQLLAPFAPHIAEELWARGNSKFGVQNRSLSYAPWPAFDPALLVEDTLEIPVQVNGKLRDVIKVPADADKAALEAAALAAEKVKAFTDGKAVKKIIVVPKKLVNIVLA